MKRLAAAFSMFVLGYLAPMSVATGQQLAPHGLSKLSNAANADSTQTLRTSEGQKAWSSKAVIAGGIAGGIVGGIAGYLDKTYLACPDTSTTSCSTGPQRNTTTGAVTGALIGALAGALISYWRS